MNLRMRIQTMRKMRQIPVIKLCPECRDGKCRNCDGIADLDENDNLVECECENDIHSHHVTPRD